MPAGTRKRSKWWGSNIPRLVGEARARADERHVAAEHVDQLRQLVEARCAAASPTFVTASGRSSL